MSFKVYAKGRSIEGLMPLSGYDPEAVGIFESLRTYRRKIFREGEHLARFMESAKTTGFKPDLALVRREIRSALSSYYKEEKNAGDVFIRVSWLAPGRVWVMIGARRHDTRLYDEGVRLKTSPVKRTLSHAAPGEIKTSDYQNAVLAGLEPRAESIYEWLFLDRHGFVTEVRIGNFFMVKDNALKTPPTPGILNGVTRRFVIECAHELGIPVREIPLMRHEVYNADEVFLTNTSWEILPVRELDGRIIGEKIPGPLTQRLRDLFQKKVKKECP